MGYSFYLISKEKEISQNDFDTAMVNLSKFNQQGHAGVWHKRRLGMVRCCFIRLLLTNKIDVVGRRNADSVSTAKMYVK